MQKSLYKYWSCEFELSSHKSNEDKDSKFLEIDLQSKS